MVTKTISNRVNKSLKVDHVINSLTISGKGVTAAEAQGIDKVIREHPELVQDAIAIEELCSKNVGEPKQLRKWSRGHQFIVRAGGHIDTWQPLYRSESPSQVLFIQLHWLTSLSSSDEPVERTLAYDNMCNLDRLRVACEPLPLPPPLDRAWLDLKKIIDKFHFPNHTSQKCKELYCPEKFKTAHPTYNTQAGEQIFIWAGRNNGIVCSMTKTRHLFYLHQIVVRRNRYMEKCHKTGRRPILPKKT